MLDMSIPYIELVMARPAGLPRPAVTLPPGYSLRAFRPGDEKAWAMIEASVREFESTGQALDYFIRNYLPHRRQVGERILFIEGPEGPAATGMAWWNEVAGRRYPWIHWIAVKPSCQGLGLGKAVVHAAVNRLADLYGDVDMYLHTQTWSHVAVGIYEKAGFVPVFTPGLGGYMNREGEQAAALLRVMKSRQ